MGTMNNNKTMITMTTTRKKSRKKKKKDHKIRNSEIKVLHEQLIKSMGSNNNGEEVVSSSVSPPRVGEELSMFYARTSDHWEHVAHANANANSNANTTTTTTTTIAEEVEDEVLLLSGKELKRQGFQLARNVYKEMEPILARLKELEDSTSSTTATTTATSGAVDEKKKRKEKKSRTKERKE